MKTAALRLVWAGWLVLSVAGCGTLEFPSRSRTGDTSISTRPEGGVPPEALAAYSMGLIEETTGNRDEAIRRYREAIAADPGHSDLKLELAVLLLQSGEHAEAERLLEQAAAVEPDLVRAYQLKALSLRVQGRLGEALVPLQKAIELEPTNALHRLECASIHARTGDVATAISTLEHALPDVPDRLVIFHALGELYLRQAGELTGQQRKKSVKLPAGPLEMLRRAAEEFPDDSYLLNQYGDLLILHHRVEEAVDVFARIEELNPDDLQLRQKLAVSLAATGNRARAIELLQSVAEQRPGNHRLWYYLGELHIQDGNQAAAIDCFKRAIEANPRALESYLKAAYLLIVSDLATEAQALLLKGLEQQPDDMRMLEMLAYVHMNQKEYDAAIDLFAKAERFMAENKTQPVLSNFHLNYAIALQMTGDLDAAARQLRAGQAAQDDLLEDFLGVTLRHRNDQQRMMSAVEIGNAVIDLLPETDGAFTMMGLVAFSAEMYGEALGYFQRAEAIALEWELDEELTAQFYFWMGACSERIKEYVQAEEYFLKAIAIEPDHADSHNYLAYMLAERGEKLDMAYDHVGVALAVEPDNAAYIDTRGWIYYKQGKFREALADIQLAHETLPDDPTIADHLGDVHQALGDTAEAVRWWRHALEKDPGNEAVQEKIQQHQPADPTPPPALTPVE